jgi:hypothetical protein
MRLLKRFVQGELRLNRIEAFSDGVFAIVVKLLVLELKVPSLHDRGSVSELRHQLRELLPKFLSWLISFVPLSTGTPRKRACLLLAKPRGSAADFSRMATLGRPLRSAAELLAHVRISERPLQRQGKC